MRPNAAEAKVPSFFALATLFEVRFHFLYFSSFSCAYFMNQRTRAAALEASLPSADSFGIVNSIVEFLNFSVSFTICQKSTKQKKKGKEKRRRRGRE